MAEYTHTTRSDLRSQLAARLGDPSMVHWLPAELDLYIAETLRKWALLTGSYRESAKFTTTTSTALYAIDSISELASLIGHARTDRDEIRMMQYMLREPVDPIDGTGMSDQFSFAGLVAALQRARDRYLADSLSVLTLGSLPVEPGSQVSLPDTIIDIRRAVWRTIDGYYSNMHLSDESEILSYDALYPTSPGIPEMYSRIAGPQQTITLSPPAADKGSIEYVAVVSGAALDPAAPVVLGVPDDAAWIVRSLALADLLGRDGPAYDPARASLCMSEYLFGLSLIAVSPRILGATINGRQVLPSSVADIDYAYASPHWQNVAGTPTQLGTIGGDVIALYPVPDSSQHSIVLDLVRKAPQPVDDGSLIQVGREDLGAILDGAEALALFKNGGSSIDDASSLIRSMIAAAARYNARIATLGYGTAQVSYGRSEAGLRPDSGTGRGTGTIAATAGLAAANGNTTKERS